MLQPKRSKYRKSHKMKIKGDAKRGHELAFGSFGIKAMDECRMTGRQLEAARIAITRFMKREGQVWIRVFPDRPVTVTGRSGKIRIQTWPSRFIKRVMAIRAA